MSKHNLDEWWQQLEEAGEPVTKHRAQPGARRSKPPKQQAEESALIQQQDQHHSFSFTYQAARYEHEWLMNYLGPLYEQRWISDVTRLVKGGKEANVYLCSAGPEMGAGWVAAKVYRPRKFRNLKNDRLYREGREDLDAEGREIKNHGMQHAMRKRTDYGQELLHTSWLAHEFNTLQILHQAGADVPKPYASANNTILMSYIGDELVAAPALVSVHLTRRKAQSLFERVLHNLHLMLRCNRVHGDLSAYNILYWDGQITLIDFPQAIAPQQNRSAFSIFERDVTRVCEYFIHHGVQLQPQKLARELWSAYNHPFKPEVHPALLDDQDDGDVAYWKSLQNG